MLKFLLSKTEDDRALGRNTFNAPRPTSPRLHARFTQQATRVEPIQQLADVKTVEVRQTFVPAGTHQPNHTADLHCDSPISIEVLRRALPSRFPDRQARQSVDRKHDWTDDFEFQFS